jgi:hypothetical protein
LNIETKSVKQNIITACKKLYGVVYFSGYTKQVKNEKNAPHYEKRSVFFCAAAQTRKRAVDFAARCRLS